MSKKDLILSLNEETFFALKKDFDTILNRTIGNMEMKGASDAVITMKLSVSLDKRSMTVDGNIQEFKKPTFKHEISSVMQIKDKMTGQLSGEYAMVWDEKEERFVLHQFDGGQTSMFDDDYETVEEEPLGTFSDMPDESLALPAPEEEDTEDSDDLDQADTVQPSDDKTTPFGWLCQFIGEVLYVEKAMSDTEGDYIVRTGENETVLSSAYSENSPFYCPAEKLAPHIGHEFVCVGYGIDDIVNVSIVSEDRSEIIVSIDAPYATYEEISEAMKVDEAYEADGEEEELEYEDPGEE